MLVKIEKASLLKEDERGKTYDFSARESSYFIILHRKQGTTSGHHYHKGSMKSKSPEIFYLISGTADLLIRDVETKEEKTIELMPGTKVEIQPNVFHSVVAKTDIILLELLDSKDDFKNYESDTIIAGDGAM